LQSLRKQEIAGMNYWRGQPINSLPHSEMERAANEAINELMGLRAIHERRENHTMLVLSFFVGASFSAAAMLVGVLLHA
jgi:hypothetical protein